ncbi:phosphoribosyltransferase family protein [Candidatus Mycobacterium methanotrophicum]|uniref:phosphoribosyltransferase family protein n=1 Tax=Candidatus Mycobacterium methanotrophicum TaxID=2943498 RepID=UPI0021037FF2|nr:phosphoribosyltransferase family protein [Candidatus Mycobacterium methanotrophicum]
MGRRNLRAVPNTTSRITSGLPHRPRNVARLVGDDPARDGPYQISRVLIEAGPVDAPRTADADRFAIPPGVHPAIVGKRVLLVDDTWTSGTSMQSAAAALKRAGAASITGLCVTRWLSWSWIEHVPLLQRVTATAFDPFSCIAYARVCRLPPT